MINLSIKKLEKYHACQDAKDWFANSKTKTLEDAYELLIKENHPKKYNWTNWIVERLLNKNNLPNPKRRQHVSFVRQRKNHCGAGL